MRDQLIIRPWFTLSQRLRLATFRNILPPRGSPYLASPTMTNIRPLVLGYIRADALTTDQEVAQCTAALAGFADREGYALSTVFVERTDKVPAAFEALMTEAARVGARAVVMPGEMPTLVPCAWTKQP